MNAELVLFLMEEGMSLTAAKEVAGANPNSPAELALLLLEAGVSPVAAARERAERAPLTTVTAPEPTRPAAFGPEVSAHRHSEPEGDRALVHHVPAVNLLGLTPKQQAALDSGFRLCANCQQPTNDHLPGCAVASGEVRLAITRDPLAPST